MRPVWERDGLTLYHADARVLMPQLEPVDLVMVDPVWPNAHPDLVGAEDPWRLWGELAACFPRLTSRLIVHLGCASDPRFLGAVPERLPFFRACWLRYTPPRYRGTWLDGADVAYCFGAGPWKPPAGRTVLPQEGKGGVSRGAKFTDHPTPRNEGHVEWLLHWHAPAGGVVLDPCAGSGTTLVAAWRLGLRAIGIEVDGRHIGGTIARLEHDTSQQRLAV